MNFKDQVIIVTGSGAGIGKNTAVKFANQGANVVIGTLSESRGQKVASFINENSTGSAAFCQVDVSSEKSVKKLVQFTIKKFNRIDILINNAGIYQTGDATSITTEDWDKVMNVNLKGAFLTSKYCIPFLSKSNNGVIVNVSSEAGIVGIKNQLAYNVSKAGLISMTKSMAIDYAPLKIRVNAVCPGTTYTPLVEKVLENSSNPAKTREDLERARPINRLGDSDEIANAILMMSSNKVGYATGSIFVIDGGFTAQ